MSELLTLRPVLESMPAGQVERPYLPMAILLQEAHDLAVALDADDGWARVVLVGLDS